MRNVRFECIKFKNDGSFEVLYKNTVVLNPDVTIPYEKIVDVLRLLYPRSDGVSIHIIG